MLLRQLLIPVALFICSQPALADELLMKNGSRLIGNLVSAEGGKVLFDTPFAGKIRVAAENIKRITTADPVTLLLDDGSMYREGRIVATTSGMAVVANGEQPVRFQAAAIDLVNPPPWKLGDGYHWFGQFSSGMLLERGNTDTDKVDLDFDSAWRSLEERYILRGLWELNEDNGGKNKDKRQLRAKYDRFSSKDPDNYYGLQVLLEQDPFADLDLRTTFGPYLGRQFYENDLLTLSGEVGVVHVDQQFNVSEDNNFWASNWGLRLTSDVIPRTKLYLNQNGAVNWGDINGVIFNTTLGLGFPLLYGFQGEVEAKWEYDGGAVEGVHDTDATYKFKLGYSW